MNGFVHRALFYRDELEWLDALLPFIRAGIAADEPMLIAVPEGRVALLRSELADELRDRPDAIVELVDMEAIGKNPGRIISAWNDFVTTHPADRRLRGIGEPVWPGRRADELVECQLHEQLLNLAFDGRAFELVCPYDISALDDDVVQGASRSHPFAGHGCDHDANPTFELEIQLHGGLTPAPSDAKSLEFNLSTLRTLRSFVSDEAADVIRDRQRVDDLVLAISEAVTNSVQYAGGGVLSLWSEPDRLICEITDGGRLTDPLVGRRRPPAGAARGRGVWMVHQICDLVQIRSADDGTVMRMAMEFSAA